jgi:hypothetical protein
MLRKSRNIFGRTSFSIIIVCGITDTRKTKANGFQGKKVSGPINTND